MGFQTRQKKSSSVNNIFVNNNWQTVCKLNTVLYGNGVHVLGISSTMEFFLISLIIQKNHVYTFDCSVFFFISGSLWLKRITVKAKCGTQIIYIKKM